MAALRWWQCLLWVFAALSSLIRAVPRLDDFTDEQIDSGIALSELNKLAGQRLEILLKSSGSSCKEPKIRKEWRMLSEAQKKSYIDAVKCVMVKPGYYSQIYAASKSLYDDFVVIHKEQTNQNHNTFSFLTWHRYFMHAYETKLNGCGYEGALPYWEWGLDVDDLEASPLFAGPNSIGGNGEYVKHEGLVITHAINRTTRLFLPPGTGGGCVTTGGLAGIQAHFGEVALPPYGPGNSTRTDDPYLDKTRCLTRDLNTQILKTYNSFRATTELLLNSSSVQRLQITMQGDARYYGPELELGPMTVGVHGGGHWSVGGNPGGDPFMSAGDPYFYFHHTQIDRVYWIWQLLDWETRKDELWGGMSYLDLNKTRPGTLDDRIDIRPLAEKVVPVRDLMSSIDGPFCYLYE